MRRENTGNVYQSDRDIIVRNGTGHILTLILSNIFTFFATATIVYYASASIYERSERYTVALIEQISEVHDVRQARSNIARHVDN